MRCNEERRSFRRSFFILAIALIAALAFGATPPKSGRKKAAPFQSMILKCSPDAETSGWSIVGGGAQNVTFEYWATGGCKAQIVARPSAAGAKPLESPKAGEGSVKHITFPSIVTADFKCSGSGSGQCYFRVSDVVKPGGTQVMVHDEANVGFACNTTSAQTIFEPYLGASEVVIRAKAPNGCTAIVKANTGASFQITNAEKFLSFAGASKITVTCTGGSTTGERCTFEVRGW
jgi:hypothetical protein